MLVVYMYSTSLRFCIWFMLCCVYVKYIPYIDYAHGIPRADSRFAPSQWETSLQSNAVSHWLGANQESALYTYNTSQVVFSWFMFCCGWVAVSFTHILQDYFTGTGAILRLPQCQWSNPKGYGSIDPQNLLGTHNIIATKESITKQRASFMKPLCIPVLCSWTFCLFVCVVLA